ncbi:AI-2E family transporter [bacterium]|nr:AI-2E family transporter [bacterium]
MNLKNPYARIGLIVLIILSLFVFLYLLRSTLMPFLIAFMIAYILDPAVDFFERRKLPRDVGIIIVFLFIIILIVTFVLLVYPTVQSEFSFLFKKFPEYVDQISTKLIPSIENRFNIRVPRKLPELFEKIQNNIPLLKDVGNKLAEPMKNFFLKAFSGAFNLIMTIVNLFIIPVFTYYLLKDFDKITTSMNNYIPFAYRTVLNRIMGNIDEALSSFIRGQITVCLILGALYSIGLLILKVPLAVVIGMTAGIANIVPYLGLCIGIVPAMGFAVLEHLDWQHPLGVIVVFILVQFLEGTIITPKIVGDKLGLNPVAVLLGILVFGNIFGFFGILLAVPLTAIFKVIFKELHDNYLKKLLFVFIDEK